MLGIFGILFTTALFLYLTFSIPVTLDDWSKIAQIITALTVAIALGNYVHQRRKDKAVAVGELVGFFRTEILRLEEDRIAELEKNRISKENIVGIEEIEEFSFMWFNERRFEEVRAQYRVKKKLERSLGYRHEKKTLDVLNALEEFCIKMEAHNIVGDEGLDSLKSAFVFTVNQSAFYIPWMMKRYDNPNMFAKVTKIYAHWYPTVKMRTPKEVAKELEREFDKADKARAAREGS